MGATVTRSTTSSSATGPPSEVDRVEAQSLFVLIGSEPRTEWLDKAVSATTGAS